MASSADDALEREKQQIDTSVFVGEEGEDPSTPAMNMGVALFLAVFALAAIYFAWGLDIPGSIYTAPGLLPILTGITLLAMAAGLAKRALKAGASFQRFKDINPFAGTFFAHEENRRGLLLIAIITVYIFSIDLLGFDVRIPLTVFTFRFGSYELFSIIALFIILKIFWRARNLQCALVSIGWIMALASVFRYGFRVLLPGSG